MLFTPQKHSQAPDAKQSESHIADGFLISVLLAIVITLCGVILQYLFERHKITPLLEFSIFFFATFITLFICIEWFVQREQQKVEDLKREEIEYLKKMEVYRREFLAEVSHELRTPIFAVQGFIHTLMDGAIDDEMVKMKFLNKAMKSTDRLSNIVNDLLVIMQLEAGEIEMRMRRFHILELVQDVVESVEAKFTKKGRNITCTILANAKPQTLVLADKERIHQVLTNLVDNAIKYGNPQGQIIIDILDTGDKVQISVTDDGPGIAAEHLDRIFQRFYRVDKSRSRETGGTGLGLAICKHFIDAHGETLEIQSEVGKGTSFSFHLRKPETALKSQPINDNLSQNT